MIGSVLTQENGGKEFVVAYLSRRFVDAETRYNSIEKFCVSLYYACIKLCHYLPTSSCTTICQLDIIKYMLCHTPVLGNRTEASIHVLRMFKSHIQAIIW
jgi:hypothetical protein